MSKGQIRRAQLITPFGVGAMLVVRDGTSLLTAGLDHWYELESEPDNGRSVSPDDFKLEEWRLSRVLKVDHFRLPPDYREKRRGIEVPNCGLTVPFLRFPQWHFCPSCNYLEPLPLTVRQRTKCGGCSKQRKTRYLLQVPFVAMCERGHLQDFPWREWVHETGNPKCQLKMRLVSTGGATLGAQKLVCDCNKERTLSQITQANPDGSTILSEKLDPAQPFMCRGMRPWLGSEIGEPCPSPLKGSLRSASNVYFAFQASAIYLPRKGKLASSQLVGVLEQPPVSTLMKILRDSGAIIQPSAVRGVHPLILQPYSDSEIADALVVLSVSKAREPSAEVKDEDDVAFRYAEFEELRKATDEENLLIREVPSIDYGPDIGMIFSRIALVHKLRETRAHAGFSRVFPENGQSLEERMDLLWRRRPLGKDSWLPAYVVHGEGIFLELDLRRLKKWEVLDSVVRRIAQLHNRIDRVSHERGTRKQEVTPRLVLVHTLSHILMNRLTFECGYSSAALRERLYVSSASGREMAAVLVYTAAGDAEGTMGGLVRMGKPGVFEPVFRRAIEAAQWCSADPVCMELGSEGGQGPDSCNLAACHNCAMIPETACELFNRILDRTLLVGDLCNSETGFFASS